MYIPAHFAQTDVEAIHGLMAVSNFATIVTAPGGTPLATHVPLVLDRVGANGRLRGHLARPNPQWQCFDGQHEALVIFQGPHAYISPAWYVTAPAVPTWNYAVVHAYGKPAVREDAEWLRRLLEDLVAQHDQTWRLSDVPEKYLADLSRGIVGFEMDIDRLEAKWKLNQHRPEGDRLGPAAALERQSDTTAHQLAALMRAIAPGSE
jgi:transcriptional regulator